MLIFLFYFLNNALKVGDVVPEPEKKCWSMAEEVIYLKYIKSTKISFLL